MIRSLRIRNFRAIADAAFEFEPFTVFVGPNGCGKTSVLRAIELIGRLRGGRVELFSPADVRSNGLSGSAGGVAELHVTLDEGEFRYSSDHPDLFPIRSATPYPNPLDDAFRNRIPPGRFLRLDVGSLAASSPPTANPAIQPSGEGLAALVVHLKGERPEVCDEIEDMLRKVVPQFVRLRYKVVANGHQLLFDMQHRTGLEPASISEGTLLSVGLITYLMTTGGGPFVFLLDDLDRAIHPRAQWELIDCIRRILSLRPGVQVVATTHSPYLLDRLHPEEVRIMSIGVDNNVVCAKLTDHPDFDRWKDAMAPGEMWSTFGESWVAERKVEAVESV